MKTYVRPMSGWWRRNPFYLWYLYRELSCVFVAAYALILLTGLARLAQGEVAFEAWLETLADPLSIGFHAVAFVFVAYHAWTWFKVMPRTLPFLSLGGWRIPDRLIVVSAVAAMLIVSMALLWLIKP